MIQLTHSNDPALENIPPEYRPVIKRALKTICSLFKEQPDPDTQGCVLFVEAHDQPHDIISVTCKPLSNLEGVYHDECCLVGVILWGNSGDGVTIICPDQQDYAPAILQTMQNHL